MFDISWSELMLVMVVALIVIGPKELPGALRMLGRMVGKLRRTADEFRHHFDETMREAGGEDLQRELYQLRHNNPLNEIRNTIENAAREVSTPPPATGAPASQPNAAHQSTDSASEQPSGPAGAPDKPSAS